MPSDSLETGLTALNELEWDLGATVSGTTGANGFRILDSDSLGVVYDDKLDSVGEVATDDADGAGDGTTPGLMRLETRTPTLGLSVVAQGASDAVRDAAMRDVLHDLRLVLSPLPNRYGGLRLLRWRRKGETAKRLWYRPGPGEPLTVPGDEARILYNAADLLCHVEGPDPTIYSDHLHTVTFTAGQEIDITNAGSICPREPNIGWGLTCSNAAGVTIENLTHGGYWRFPAGPVTVTPDLQITGPGTYGVVYGPASTLFPAAMGLRPGVNRIKASAACTFSWRDTY